MESQQVGDLFEGLVRVAEQVAGAVQPDAQVVLFRARVGMGFEHFPETGVAKVQLAGQVRQVERFVAAFYVAQVACATTNQRPSISTWPPISPANCSPER